MEYKARKDRDFDLVYHAYKSDVYKVAIYFTRLPEVAEEITQRAFYQLYLHFDNIKLDTARAYLIRSTKNITYNWQRDRDRQRHMENLEIWDIELPQDYSAEEHYLRKVEIMDAEKLSDSILTKLQEKNELWYEAVVLSYVLEKPQEEVAQELGITMDVLYSRLYRAKQWIRKNYTEQYEQVYRYS